MGTTTIYLLLIEVTVLVGGVASLLIKRAEYLSTNANPGRIGLRVFSFKLNPSLKSLEDKLPVPWGWPNHQPRHPRRVGNLSASEAMFVLMDCLISEKQVLEESTVEPEKQSDKPSRQQELYSQMIQARKTGSTLEEEEDMLDRSRKRARHALLKKHGGMLNYHDFEIHEIKRPWGW